MKLPPDPRDLGQSVLRLFEPLSTALKRYRLRSALKAKGLSAKELDIFDFHIAQKCSPEEAYTFALEEHEEAKKRAAWKKRISYRRR